MKWITEGACFTPYHTTLERDLKKEKNKLVQVETRAATSGGPGGERG